MKKAILYTDGGSRGNPGPAGIGAVLRIGKKGSMNVSSYIGKATNNQAEYEALIAGLKLACKEGVTHLLCYLDSELVVKQMRGEYRVKNVNMRPLFEKASDLREKFSDVTFRHVMREKNKEADALVNRAIDKAVK